MIERKIKNVKNKLEKSLEKINNTYKELYHFCLQEDDGRLYIIDEFENFYYSAPYFDECMENIEKNLKKIIEDEELYLDCVIIGRWQIVSENIEQLYMKYNQNIIRNI